MSPFQSLTLPNGSTIPNRLAKAAMEEGLAGVEQAPTRELVQLYRAWAEGGAGLLLTGNVMVDSGAMTGPGGVALENEKSLQKFREWARAGRSGGAQFWMQISHPGRQTPANLGQQALAPSAIPLELGKLSKMFATPKAMSEDDIAEVIQRFARTSGLAEQAGFTGVEIHAAHGYLLSQFLSPLSNKRVDRWGGTLENRARLLLEVVRAVRAVVAPDFSVAVKLNSADFQRGGFDVSDARRVVEMLNGLPVDLVELSGGSYEAPAMQGTARDGRTLAREAYFLEFASEIAASARMPVMVTGGIRRLAVAEQILDSGINMVGIATALAIAPQLPREWREGKDRDPQVAPIRWKNKALASLAYMAVVRFQMHRLGRGRQSKPDISPLWAFLWDQLGTQKHARRYRRWMTARNPVALMPADAVEEAI
ncbi:NADH:flavin oxidoreductase/NADH oxidase family protein [Dyella silvatica]|uniref:NADH:flavin oxidoreductase/NADH oxidase family protein n=1 Tax=Dyella silvatica TaxID=2992128 RepID=UPI00225B41B1|nr:NADH:flavin oxidoreductase/NADH oxidase family protein [Dyella silvatica]